MYFTLVSGLHLSSANCLRRPHRSIWKQSRSSHSRDARSILHLLHRSTWSNRKRAITCANFTTSKYNKCRLLSTWCLIRLDATSHPHEQPWQRNRPVAGHAQTKETPVKYVISLSYNAHLARHWQLTPNKYNKYHKKCFNVVARLIRPYIPLETCNHKTIVLQTTIHSSVY
jgi:hypothetical protein